METHCTLFAQSPSIVDMFTPPQAETGSGFKNKLKLYRTGVSISNERLTRAFFIQVHFYISQGCFPFATVAVATLPELLSLHGSVIFAQPVTSHRHLSVCQSSRPLASLTYFAVIIRDSEAQSGLRWVSREKRKTRRRNMQRDRREWAELRLRLRKYREAREWGQMDQSGEREKERETLRPSFLLGCFRVCQQLLIFAWRANTHTQNVNSLCLADEAVLGLFSLLSSNLRDSTVNDTEARSPPHASSRVLHAFLISIISLSLTSHSSRRLCHTVLSLSTLSEQITSPLVTQETRKWNHKRWETSGDFYSNLQCLPPVSLPCSRIFFTLLFVLSDSVSLSTYGAVKGAVMCCISHVGVLRRT